MSLKRKQDQSNQPTPQKSLRLWPGIVIVIIQCLLWYVIPFFIPEALMISVFGVLIGGVGVIVWWAFFSRAPGIERWGAIVVMIAAMVLISFFLDNSIALAQGGLTFIMYSLPILCFAFVVWAIVTRNLSNKVRRITMVVTILLSCSIWIFLRTDGMTSDIGHDFSWRWAELPENQFQAQIDNEMMAVSVDSIVETGADWPGFRGPDRNGIIYGLQIDTDWSSSPPVKLWSRLTGPGFSSFAVRGDLIFTQEQRGEEEDVACYNLNSGEPVWRHSDTIRFFGAAAYPGPRATPTISGNRVFTLGATGTLNLLNVLDGTVIWSQNTVSDAKVSIPAWGVASSPLVVDDIVIVQVANKLVAYAISSGELRWSGDVGSGYSSPQLFTIDSVEQVLLLSGVGLTSFSPVDGTILWEHLWAQDDRILQPAITSNGDIILSGVLQGKRRISVTNGSEGWSTKRIWGSDGMKSNFNDFVVHKNYAYGYDNQNLACIDLQDGTLRWKGKRYGGQVMLLADQGLLLVLSEKGKLVLVSATPDKFNEIASFSVLKGKTWNHAAVVNDILLVRNAQEMAAYRLSKTIE
ncbi:PQQ-binding-like beta-propeller repeat protein [Bacteroidota bacterium]